MFGFKNETKRVSSPCDVGQSCKSLKTALLIGDLDPTRDIYEYCDADGASFSGNKMDACTQCYSNTDTTSHLSNCKWLFLPLILGRHVLTSFQS